MDSVYGAGSFLGIDVNGSFGALEACDNNHVAVVQLLLLAAPGIDVNCERSAMLYKMSKRCNMSATINTNKTLVHQEIAVYTSILVAVGTAFVCTLFVMFTSVSQHEMKTVILSCVVMFMLLYVSVMTGIKLGNAIDIQV